MGETTVILFNYGMLAWIPDDAKVGIFAVRDESEQCHAYICLGCDYTDLTTDSNAGGKPGLWIQVNYKGNNLECTTKFETECPEPDQGTS